MVDQEKIDLLKQLRTNAKISISKKISKIDQSIDQDKSYMEVLELYESLQTKVKTAAELTGKLINADSDHESECRDWLKEVISKVADCEARKDQFLVAKQSNEKIEVVKNSEKINIDENLTADKLSMDLEVTHKDKCEGRKINTEHQIEKKIGIVHQRIHNIKLLIHEKCSPSKVRVLHEKLQIIVKELKQLSESSLSESLDMDYLLMDVDGCSGDVAEYLDAGNICHSEEKRENSPRSKYHQIKRIELPKFRGDKKEYFFMESCI